MFRKIKNNRDKSCVRQLLSDQSYISSISRIHTLNVSQVKPIFVMLIF